MDLFLKKLNGVFGELVYNLEISHQANKDSKFGNTVYFKILFEQLSTQTKRIYEIVDNLQKVNYSFMKEN
jgi:hypothetical protein